MDRETVGREPGREGSACESSLSSNRGRASRRRALRSKTTGSAKPAAANPGLPLGPRSGSLVLPASARSGVHAPCAGSDRGLMQKADSDCGGAGQLDARFKRRNTECPVRSEPRMLAPRARPTCTLASTRVQELEMDDEALRRLLELGRRAARRVTKDPYVVEEAASDAIAAMVSQVRTGGQIENRAAWCWTAAKHAAMKHLRHQHAWGAWPDGFEPAVSPQQRECWAGSVSRVAAECFLRLFHSTLPKKQQVSLESICTTLWPDRGCARSTSSDRNLVRTISRLALRALPLLIGDCSGSCSYRNQEPESKS